MHQMYAILMMHPSGVFIMKKLTKHQSRILEFLLKHHELYGFPPTVSEIAAEFDLRSPRTVRDYLLTLQHKGYIKLHTGKKRGIEILKGHQAGIPVVGRIAAGTPIIATENAEDILEVQPGFFTTAPSFAVRVRGDSMIGAGIMDGDYVIFRQQNAADNGQIVAALIDDEVTIKRYKTTNSEILLLPENTAYDPIVLSGTDPPTILGVMVGLLRKL